MQQIRPRRRPRSARYGQQLDHARRSGDTGAAGHGARSPCELSGSLSGTSSCGSWPPSSTSPGPSPRRLRTSPSSPPPQAPCEYVPAATYGQEMVCPGLVSLCSPCASPGAHGLCFQPSFAGFGPVWGSTSQAVGKQQCKCWAVYIRGAAQTSRPPWGRTGQEDPCSQHAESRRAGGMSWS